MTDPTDSVPDWLVRFAAIAWRLLVVGAAVYFTWQVLQRVRVVVLAVIIGLFPAALLWGPVRALKRRGWRPILATWAVLLGAAAVVTGIGYLGSGQAHRVRTNDPGAPSGAFHTLG